QILAPVVSGKTDVDLFLELREALAWELVKMAVHRLDHDTRSFFGHGFLLYASPYLILNGRAASASHYGNNMHLLAFVSLKRETRRFSVRGSRPCESLQFCKQP